ncbi:MAG: glycoside hydrolase family 127 protein [Opitutus sp.]|nr:glycoside hydrolase family 127 protein [Opitutus sp.]
MPNPLSFTRLFVTRRCATFLVAGTAAFASLPALAQRVPTTQTVPSLVAGAAESHDPVPATGPTAGVYRYAKVKPVAPGAVKLDGGFWGRVRTLSRDVGVPTLLVQFEKHGHIENFRICTTQALRAHFSGANTNEFLHKQLEAMGWYAAESPVVAALHRETARTIVAAQQPDGYLNTYYENAAVKSRGQVRFDPKNRFEFYIFGHFAQAAMAHFRSTGDRTLLDAAVKFANLLVAQFAAPRQLPYTLYRGSVNQKYEHPNHELALIDLYRVTGDRRYLDFVTQTYTEYGYFAGQHFNEMWGHAVQENLLEAGAADLFLETGDRRIWNVVSKLWDDMHTGKMYITGGTGATGKGEAYGKAFELPNATAYAETCAAIALTFWHHKMLLATGQARFADEMERALCNNVLAGYGLNGWTYFYTNTLDWSPARTSPPSRPDQLVPGGRRFVWHVCPCCPPNLHRLFASLGQYLYTHDDTGVQVNLYADSTLVHQLPDGHSLQLSQKTAYPWSGTITLTMQAEPAARGTLRLRVPEWCEEPGLKIDGKPIAAPLQHSYLVVDRPWAVGQTLELTLPMRARTVAGNPRVADQVNRVAIQRGPVVYCVEQADNPGVDLDRLHFPDTPRITEQLEPHLLGGVVRLTVPARQTEAGGGEREIMVKLIPYYAWANREPGRMMVWLPTKPKF